MLVIVNTAARQQVLHFRRMKSKKLNEAIWDLVVIQNNNKEKTKKDDLKLMPEIVTEL